MKKNWYWVARGKGVWGDNVELWHHGKQPTWCDKYHEWDPGNGRFLLISLCYKEFRAVTGMTIKRGECIKARFSVKRLK